MKCLSKEQRKAKAIKIMQKMGMDKHYVDAFEQGTLYCFNVTSTVQVETSSTLYQRVKELERKDDCTVFAITHEKFSFGECYTFLLVLKESFVNPFMPSGEYISTHFAYVWNIDKEHFSEFGSVNIYCGNGQIFRI